MNIGAECVTTDALRDWCQGINGGGSSIHSNKSPRTEALQVLRHWLLSCHGAVPTWVIFGYFWKQGSIPSSQSQNCCNLITVFWHVDLIIWPSALNPEPRQTSGTTGGCSSGKGCKDTKWYKQGHTIYDSSWWALSHITDQQWDSSLSLPGNSVKSVAMLGLCIYHRPSTQLRYHKYQLIQDGFCARNYGRPNEVLCWRNYRLFGWYLKDHHTSVAVWCCLANEIISECSAKKRMLSCKLRGALEWNQMCHDTEVIFIIHDCSFNQGSTHHSKWTFYSITKWFPGLFTHGVSEKSGCQIVLLDFIEEIRY